MTTFQDLLDRRQAERQAELEALEIVEAEKIERIATEMSKVFWLFQRDVLQGVALPRGANIAALISNEHGHQISVCFPGNLSIDAEHLYTAQGDVLLSNGRMNSQRWTARNHPIGEQETFHDFFNAALWLLPRLETPPPASPVAPERPAMAALLHAAERLCIGLGVMESRTFPLWAILDRHRCTCGEFPVEGYVRRWWMVRCCGHEWESWDEFVAWREEQDAEKSAS